MSAFTAAELEYLAGQPLARLATVAPDGSPQTRPVGFAVNADLGTVDVGGRDMERSRKYRNVAADPRVSLVVDDLASTRPWRPRGVEIRGRAEAVPRGDSGAVIRIHPHRVLSWGIDSDPFAPPRARDVDQPTGTSAPTPAESSPTTGPVTLVNVFTVPVAESAGFLDRWRDNAAVMAARPGFRHATMHQALSGDAEFRFVNVAEWDDAAALRDAQADPAFRESVARIADDPSLHVVARPAIYRAAERVLPAP